MSNIFLLNALLLYLISFLGFCIPNEVYSKSGSKHAYPVSRTLKYSDAPNPNKINYKDSKVFFPLNLSSCNTGIIVAFMTKRSH
jgi:hypothetical protein